jgi:hypothetical protein
MSVAEYMALKRRLFNALTARVRPGAGGSAAGSPRRLAPARSG